MRRDVFQAIADPTRRRILSVLSTQPLNLNSVAENFDVSRPAVSKHIKILTECGLVTITQHGRERYCEAKLAKLNEVSEWVEQYRKFWEDKFDSLEAYLHKLQTPGKQIASDRFTVTKKQTPEKKNRNADRKRSHHDEKPTPKSNNHGKKK